jgi:hypothetical protein
MAVMIFSNRGSRVGEHDIEFIARDRTREVRGSKESGGGTWVETAGSDGTSGDKGYAELSG